MTVDTLKIVDILRKAGVDQQLAEAHAIAFQEATKGELATKADITEMKVFVLYTNMATIGLLGGLMTILYFFG